uniref:Uncharacterized protein n=1 Tax=Anguilla anguilla TaxID=7936 RepID=A0A0E9QMZ7_ANGAN
MFHTMLNISHFIVPLKMLQRRGKILRQNLDQISSYLFQKTFLVLA